MFDKFWKNRRKRVAQKDLRNENRKLESRVFILTDEKKSLEDQLKHVEEELEIERVKNRIQKVEIDELTQVVARNLVRVLDETGAYNVGES